MKPGRDYETYNFELVNVTRNELKQWQWRKMKSFHDRRQSAGCFVSSSKPEPCSEMANSFLSEILPFISKLTTKKPNRLLFSSVGSLSF